MAKKRISMEDYSALQRCMGNLEGIGAVIPDNAADCYFGCLETLDSIIEKIKPEVPENV